MKVLKNNGDSTQNQDQSIYPVNLSPMNNTVNRFKNPDENFTYQLLVYQDVSAF